MERPVTLPSDTRSPIFIGGHPGSGTELLRLMLGRHPRVACGPESGLLEHTSFLVFHRFAKAAWMTRIRRYGFGKRELELAMGAFLDTIFTAHQGRVGKERWAEATPSNILHIDYLFRLFPGAQLIHVIRDPRGLQCSIQEGVGAGTAPETAHEWVRYIERGLPWRSATDRYREVRYEELVTDPARAMQDALAFLGEPWDASVLEGWEDAGQQDLSARSVPVDQWRHMVPPAEVHQIEAVAGAHMQRLGYALTQPAQEVGARS